MQKLTFFIFFEKSYFLDFFYFLRLRFYTEIATVYNTVISSGIFNLVGLVV